MTTQHLPDEILEEIFNFVDANSIRSFLAASTKYTDQILSIPKITNKLTVQLNEQNWMSELPFIIKYAKLIKHVEISFTDGSWMLFKLLLLMPNIFTLKMKFCDQEEIDKVKNDLMEKELISLLNGFDIYGCINLPKLKVFKADISDVDPSFFFKQLKHVKTLKKFSLKTWPDHSTVRDFLTPFLCQQNELKFLEFNVEQLFLIFTHETIQNMNFKLKTLKINQTLLENNYFYLDIFLDTQLDCLEELHFVSPACKLRYINNEGIGLLQRLISSSIKHLVIMADNMLLDIGTWTLMSRNLPNLQTLIIKNSDPDEFTNFLNRFVQNHRNLILATRNSRGLKRLELHLPVGDVLKFKYANGNLNNICGSYCCSESYLLKNKTILEMHLGNFCLEEMPNQKIEE